MRIGKQASRVQWESLHQPPYSTAYQDAIPPDGITQMAKVLRSVTHHLRSSIYRGAPLQDLQRPIATLDEQTAVVAAFEDGAGGGVIGGLAGEAGGF